MKEASNLPGKDLNGLSDPYFKLTAFGEKHRSPTVKKNLNPQWNWEKTIQCEPQPGENTMELIVFNYRVGRIRKNFIGQCWIDLTNPPVRLTALQLYDKKRKKVKNNNGDYSVIELQVFELRPHIPEFDGHDIAVPAIETFYVSPTSRSRSRDVSRDSSSDSIESVQPRQMRKSKSLKSVRMVEKPEIEFLRPPPKTHSKKKKKPKKKKNKKAKSEPNLHVEAMQEIPTPAGIALISGSQADSLHSHAQVPVTITQSVPTPPKIPKHEVDARPRPTVNKPVAPPPAPPPLPDNDAIKAKSLPPKTGSTKPQNLLAEIRGFNKNNLQEPDPESDSDHLEMVLPVGGHTQSLAAAIASRRSVIDANRTGTTETSSISRESGSGDSRGSSSSSSDDKWR